MLGSAVESLPITTKRLLLRTYRADDAEAVLELYGDPEVVRYLYSEPLDRSGLDAAMARRLAPPRLEHDDDRLDLALVERATGEFVGAGMFRLQSAEHRRGEIGYTLLPRFEGRGYATECARALLAFGFDRLGLHRIEGQCDARNTASSAVMARAGMRPEAHLRENEWVKGDWTDMVVYGLLEDEWRAGGLRT